MRPCDNHPVRVILASQSPRRRQLLAQTGLAFDMDAPDVSEATRSGETPEAYVARLAEAKARAVGRRDDHDTVVVGADTTVVLGGRILGKPADPAGAKRMLADLAGREHRVLTAVAVRRGVDLTTTVVSTNVRMTPMTPGEIEWYAASREPLDKAGAYAIQGIGGLFVESISGSYSNVVGLPLAETASLLRGAGVVVPAVPSRA